MRIITNTHGNVTVVQPKESLIVQKTKPFLKVLDELSKEKKFQVVLDLGDVYDVSLIAMVGIANFFNQCQQAGGALRIAAITPGVKKDFEQTNFINTVESFQKVSEAIKAFDNKNLLRSKLFNGSYFDKDRKKFVGWDRLPQSDYLN